MTSEPVGVCAGLATVTSAGATLVEAVGVSVGVAEVVGVGVAVERNRAGFVGVTDSIHQQSTSPPQAAAELLLWILPKDRRDALIGDLEEEYQTIVVPKLGASRARRWFWFQAIRSVVPVLRSWALRTSVGAGIISILDWISGQLR